MLGEFVLQLLELGNTTQGMEVSYAGLFGSILGAIPGVGGVLRGASEIFSGIGKGKREDRAEGRSDEELALLRERQEAEQRRKEAFFQGAKDRFLDKAAPVKEDLSGLYSSNPFIGGKKELGASAGGAASALGFAQAPPPTGGPIQAEAPSPGPGREVEPKRFGRPSKVNPVTGRPINVGDQFLENISSTDVQTGEDLGPGAHRGTVETQKALLSLFGGKAPAAELRRKATERFRLPGVRGKREVGA